MDKFKKSLILIITIFVLQGCNTVEPEHILDLHPGVNDITIEHDGLSRSLYIILPADFQEEHHYPVLFFFHGLGGNRNWGRDIFRDLISGETFIGISPQGVENSWNEGSGGVPSTADDVGFTLEILQQLVLSNNINIDRDRIYSMGYSNGGAFSYILALSTDEFAAIASASASFFEDMTIAPDVSKISVYHLHGDQDQDVPFHGGQSISLDIIFQSAMDTVLHWVRHNEISEIPAITYPENMLKLHTFKDDNNPYEVILGVLEETTHDIGTHQFVSSNRWYHEIWEFFKKHQKQ